MGFPQLDPSYNLVFCCCLPAFAQESTCDLAASSIAGAIRCKGQTVEMQVSKLILIVGVVSGSMF